MAQPPISQGLTFPASALVQSPDTTRQLFGGNGIRPEEGGDINTFQHNGRIEANTLTDVRDPASTSTLGKVKDWYNHASTPKKVGVWALGAAAFTGVVLLTLHGAFKASGMYDN